MKTDSVNLRGERTTVRRWGSDGPTVVVAHSVGLDGRSAQWFGAALAALGARVVAIDLRGHAGSTSLPERVSLSEIACDLSEVPAVLGLDRPHLLGTSIGGVVGSLAARISPHAYRSLTILCSPDRGYPTFLERAAEAEIYGMGAVVDQTLERWFTAQQLGDDDASVELARESVVGMRVDRWAALWRDFARFDGHPNLRGILPVQCIAGALDQSTSLEVMTRVAEAVGSEMQVVREAPHQALMTHADEIAQLWAARNL